MGIKHNRILLSKVLLLLVVLLGGLTVGGCVGIKSTPEGGSGGTVANGTLYLSPASRAAGGFGCEAPSTTGKLVALNVPDGSRLWEATLESSKPATGGFGCATASVGVVIYGSPAVGSDLVYVGGYSGQIYALSSTSGALRWVYPRQGSFEPIVGGAVVALGKVYFGCSDGKVYALDAETGDPIWEFSTGGKIWSTPAVDDGTLYIGSFDKKLYALNAEDGSTRWEFKTEGAIVSTPIVYDDTVYFGSFDRYFYAVDATDGSLRWKFMGENWFWAKAVAYNNVIYAPCLDGKVYVLDAASGREVVDAIDLRSPVSSSPVLVDELLIIASEEGKVYSLDTANNQTKQLADVEAKVYAPLSFSDGAVYIHTEQDSLYAMDALTGTRREFNIK